MSSYTPTSPQQEQGSVVVSTRLVRFHPNVVTSVISVPALSPETKKLLFYTHADIVRFQQFWDRVIQLALRKKQEKRELQRRVAACQALGLTPKMPKPQTQRTQAHSVPPQRPKILEPSVTRKRDYSQIVNTESSQLHAVRRMSDSSLEPARKKLAPHAA